MGKYMGKGVFKVNKRGQYMTEGQTSFITFICDENKCKFLISHKKAHLYNYYVFLGSPITERWSQGETLKVKMLVSVTKRVYNGS